MRKLLIFICLSICCYFSFGQDIIITKEGKSIKAKIIILNSEKVSYKKYDYQEGATIELETSKIKTIVWGNGDVDEFDIIEKKEVVEPEKTVNSPEEKRDYYDKEKENAASDKLHPIVDRNSNGVFFSDGKYMYNHELQEFLNINNMGHIYTRYYGGLNQLQTGLGLLIGGLVVEGLGAFVFFSTFNENEVQLGSRIGFAFMIVGGILEIASIPTMIVGGTKRAKAIDSYNESIYVRYSYQPTLKIGFTGNGIGMTFSF
jgi:hypothetical protein